jgi:GTPase Era involved in 16S rRNA processing
MDSESKSSSSSNGNASFRADGLLPPTVDFESLRRYTSAKLSIANQLRSLLDLLKKRGDEARVRSCEQLMAKLAGDRFSIAVLGQFKRGKSSLLNAIIGRDLLPIGVLPLTSVITIVKFGARERLVIQRKGLQSPEHQPIAALPDYVTQRHNPENHKGIQTVAIELPLPFLRRGLQFVDTPGVGSAIKANTETTYAFLPNCDAVLFVTGADSPLSEAELELLSAIRRYAGKIFFVLNKIDLLSDGSETIHVVEFIKSLLSQELGVSKINLIPVSAQQGLEASLSQSASQFARSGVLYLEETLAQFLANEREAVFLKAVIDGARRLLDRELSETELRDQANQVAAAERDSRVDSIKVGCKRLKTERLEVLERIREELAKYVFGPTAQEMARCLSTESDAAIRWLDLFLRKGGAHLAASVTRRYSKRIARRFWTRISRWIGQNEDCLLRGIDAVSRDGLQRLRSNLRDLAVLPSKAFALPVTEPSSADEESDALQVRPEFDIAFAEGWSPTIPGSLRFWPTFAVRPWLRNLLRIQLLTFVSKQQGAALNAIWKRVDETLGALSGRVSEHAADLEERSMVILSDRADRLEEEFRGRKAPVYRDQLMVIYKNLSVFREQVQASLKTRPDVAFVATQPIPVPSLKASFTPAVRTGVGHAYITRGCPVCDHLVSLSKEFFAKFQYALYNDEREQESLAESGGFCQFHIWQLEAISSPVDFSVGCAKLVKRISGLLEQTTTSPERAKETLKQLLLEPKRCQVCTLLREAEQERIKTLSTSLLEAETKKLYTRSQGVCLRHLEMLVEESSNEETTIFLLQTASTVFRLISEDMESFALKREAIRRYLASEDEEDAYLRAVIHLAGAKHNCVPWT